MQQYSIYCTEEQTKKALGLGAPIRDSGFGTEFHAINPTAEQMIGWLALQGIAIDIHTYFSVGTNKISHYQFTVTDLTRVFNGEYSSRKETTLTAIDAALDYLSNIKEN